MGDAPSVLAARYRLTDSIGRGGMADVYAAEDTTDGGMVAVKIMRVGDHADPARFAAEMKILSSLRHPAILRLLNSGTTDDEHPYFVMPLVVGESLSARLRRAGPLNEEEAEDIGSRVASALAHAHAAQVVHRDIKPANILIDTDGAAFLTDFGVARVADATSVDVQTHAGTTIGTAAYLAPEQLQDSQVGPEADIYSLGLVMLEALTGKRAFRGTGVEAAMARLSRDPGIPRSLPAPWIELLVAMTRRAPERRPSAEEVANALRGVGSVPTTSSDEIAARTFVPDSGDDDPTAVVVPTDTGPTTGGSGQWDPPSGGSAPSVPTPAAGPTTPAPSPPETTPPAESTPAGESAPTPTPPPAPPATTGDGPPSDELATEASGSDPEAEASTDARPRGFDAIRSRALLVGLILGAVGVLLMFALITLLATGDDGVTVHGEEPVDEATREVLGILEASERLGAADPALQRSLLNLAEGVVEAVNADRWDTALLGVIEMTNEARSAIEALDIEPVALEGLLSALRDLTREIEAAAEVGASEEADDGG